MNYVVSARPVLILCLVALFKLILAPAALAHECLATAALATAGKAGRMKNIVSGDFDNDGLVDFVIWIRNRGFSVWRGFDGENWMGFDFVESDQAADGYALNFTSTLAAVDFNNDGNLDLAITRTGELVLFEGKGDGTFAFSTLLPIAEFGSNAFLRVADLNGDAYPDLISSRCCGFGLHVGDGMGFSTVQEQLIGMSFDSAEVGDFNGDGVTDVAVLDDESVYFVPVMPGPSIGAQELVTTGGSFTEFAVLDYDGDGKDEIAVTSNSVPNAIQVWSRGPSGDFSVVATQLLNGFPNGMHSADINGDGLGDLACSFSSGRIEFFVCNVDGTLALLDTHFGPSIGTGGQEIVPADFDGDGINDSFLLRSVFFHTLAMSSAGGLQFSQWGLRAPIVDRQAVDLDLDGEPELLGSFETLHDDLGFVVYRRAGDRLDAGRVYSVPADGVQEFTVGDITADGLPDVVTCNGVDSAHLFPNLGDGNFGEPIPLLLPPSVDQPEWVLAGQFCGSPHDDLVVSDGNEIVVLENDGVGGLSVGGEVAFATSSSFNVESVDWDLDGDLDIFRFTNGHCDFLRNAGGGQFEVSSVSIPTGWTRIALGDLNGDGYPEIFLANNQEPATIIMNDGFGGPLQLVTSVAIENYPTLVDLNGDGAAELIDGTLADVGGHLLWENDGTGNFSLVGTIPLPSLVQGAFDVNGDGQQDLLAWGSVDFPAWYLPISSLSNCDGTLVLDVCESHVDCDGNSVLDDCEIYQDPTLDCDGDGQLDTCQILSDLTLDLDVDGLLDQCEADYLPGDCNEDGALQIGDALAVVEYLFLAGQVECSLSCDFDGSGAVVINDAVSVVSYLFLSGPAPAGGLACVTDLDLISASSCTDPVCP